MSKAQAKWRIIPVAGSDSCEKRQRSAPVTFSAWEPAQGAPPRYKSQKAHQSVSGTLKRANGQEDEGIPRQELLRDAVESLRGSLAARGYAREGSWVPSIGNLKISQALQELVKPYLSEQTDLIEARVVALIAGVAWNLASAPEVGRDEREDLRAHLAPESAASLDRLLKHMRKRKRELFPDDQRIISQTYVHVQSDGTFFFTAAAVTT